MATDKIVNLTAQLEIKDDDNSNKILERLAELESGEETSKKKVVSQLSKLDIKDDAFVINILKQLAGYHSEDGETTLEDLASALTELKISEPYVNYILKHLALLHVKDENNVSRIHEKLKKLDIHSPNSVDEICKQLKKLFKKDDPISEKAEALVLQVEEFKNYVHKYLKQLISELEKLKTINVGTVSKILKQLEILKQDSICVDEIYQQLDEMKPFIIEYIDFICEQLKLPIEDNYVNVNVDEIIQLQQELKDLNTDKVAKIVTAIKKLQNNHAKHETQMKELAKHETQMKENVDTLIDKSSKKLTKLSQDVDNVVDDILDTVAHLDRKEDIFVIKIFKPLMDQLKVDEDNAESSTNADYLQELQQDHKDALRLLGHFAICFRLGYGQYGSMNLGNGGSQYTLVRKYILYLRQRKSQPTLRQRLAEPFKDLPEYGSLNTSGPGGQGPSKKTFNKCLVGVRDTIQQLSGVIMLYHRQLSKK